MDSLQTSANGRDHRIDKKTSKKVDVNGCFGCFNELDQRTKDTGIFSFGRSTNTQLHCLQMQ
tara:strand:+ start:453 stop:638 length:186 start_codon:yes stop_codon:yes gene_type:complete